uniref:Large ribosomal subunit protein uL24m n=1 Tax=Meloidogyne hapla TaxID=6305 RepID=A0A1I8BMP3_MELHA
MFKTPILSGAKRYYLNLDYARHMPKAYVDRMKRHVPTKVYDNRFGAPPIVRWAVPPDDYKPLVKDFDDGSKVPQAKRCWEMEAYNEQLSRERDHKIALFSVKFFRKGRKLIPKIPDEQWTIFPGDQVEVMIGADRGKKGVVSHVIREENAVFVEGLHTKLVETVPREAVETHEIPQSTLLLEQPLFVHKGEVKLIDPNDNESCTVKWVPDEDNLEYVRVSTRTGYQIPIPLAAKRTYEYTSPDKYIEIAGKDTPADVALLSTYEPKLSTFEEEIEEEMGLKKREYLTKTDDSKRPQTFWY